MVLCLRLVGTGEELFYRDFEINNKQTFFDLHNAIQEELEYDKKQMASFFIANDKWEKGLEINLFDMSEETHAPVIVMDKTQLCELLFKEKQRLLYVFDFFSDRSFFIELSSIIPVNKNKKYPLCTSGRGNPPKQIIMDDPGHNNI